MHLNWPLLFIPFFVVMNIALLITDLNSGIIAAVFVILYSVFAVVVFSLRRTAIITGLVDFATDYNKQQQRLSRELMIPYAVLDLEGRIIWFNNEFSEIVKINKAMHQHVHQVFDGIDAGVLPTSEQDSELHIVYDGRNYLAKFRRIKAADSNDDIYWIYEDSLFMVKTF